LMYKHPKLFLGLDFENISVVDSLSRRIDCKDIEQARMRVLVVLRKVRLNESYNLLGLFLGFSPKTISKYFRESVMTVSACLEQAIFRPPKERIVLNMPKAFRYRYSQTDEIIDAFEFQIARPSDAKLQNATYSAYKHFNGLKAVIAATPDGFVTAVTDCFGGRVSDIEICMRSGYVDNLRKGMVIMADRGFKHLENRLQSRGCKLIRPPSCSAKAPLSEAECLQAKQVASLRIHVERVIGRIRGYAMVSPHSCLHPSLIPYADFAVRIAAGLVNLQKPLIKI
jgi:DDE superfamily endonuclease